MKRTRLVAALLLAGPARGHEHVRGRIAPPASQFCAAHYGLESTLHERTGAEYAICIFDDGTACDTWRFFHHECNKGEEPLFATFCEGEGGRVQQKKVDWGTAVGGAEAEYGVCRKGQLECDEHAYYATRYLCDVSGGSAVESASMRKSARI